MAFLQNKMFNMMVTTLHKAIVTSGGGF